VGSGFRVREVPGRNELEFKQRGVSCVTYSVGRGSF
jgi:hypothetical protein